MHRVPIKNKWINLKKNEEASSLMVRNSKNDGTITKKRISATLKACSILDICLLSFLFLSLLLFFSVSLLPSNTKNNQITSNMSFILSTAFGICRNRNNVCITHRHIYTYIKRFTVLCTKIHVLLIIICLIFYFFLFVR